MRVIATATVLVLGLTTGLAEAQYMPIPKTFQPSLEAAKKREAVKIPPLTAATPVKDTLYRIGDALGMLRDIEEDRKSTRLNSSHTVISYAVFCLKKKTNAPLT